MLLQIRTKAPALLRFYNGLTRNEELRPSDLIFVFAGKMERKQYGLDLYRENFAPRLLLGVGRYEISRMATAGFNFAEELIALRDRTVPKQRHFFVEIDRTGAHIERPSLPVWNTYGEVLGLRRYLAGDSATRVIIVSTDIHLRRIAVTIENVFKGSLLDFRYCPVPSSHSSLSRAGWWSRREDRSFVFSESVKLLAYRAIFLMPGPAVRFLMRLKR